MSMKLSAELRRRINAGEYGSGVGAVGMRKGGLGKAVRVPASARYAYFPAFCDRMGLPVPVAEFRFHGERKWRMDMAWVKERVYLEIQGGIFTNGRHSRGAAMLKEWEKVNTASGMGWRVLYCQPADLTKPATFEAIRAALNFAVDASKPTSEKGK